MKTTVLSTALGSLLALGAITTVAGAAEKADDSNTEKCYGIAKAGKNDCAGAAHACSGQSKTNASGKEWVKLPKGTCDRLVGGSLAAK
ncbi:MAG: DUF2282 domain-containing protein [Pseudomonadota bacterium]